MMKHKLYILPILLTLCFIPNLAYAGFFGNTVDIIINALVGGNAMEKLTNHIVDMTSKINAVSSNMMKLGDMLLCSSLHGSAADVSLEVMGIDVYSTKLVDPFLWFSGFILYMLGFFILMIASFYMFDVAFNLSISITLLPLALALWPFGVTRDKLKQVIESITFYVGVFIFLPLGILVANSIVQTVIENAINASDFNFEEAYFNDEADLISGNLNFFTLTFLKLLLCYIVAIRIIPLFANDFCSYFFGNALTGNALSQKAAQIAQMLKKQGKKVGKYGKDVVKHQTGSAIEKKHKGKSGLGHAIAARMGRRLARTRR